jgi:predicted P-loop ATPase
MIHPPMSLSSLADVPRWVMWKNIKRNGKLTKVPYDPRTGREAKANDPTTWATRTDAETALPSKLDDGGGGVGIELGDLGNGLAIGGLDLDSCRRADGTFEPWAIEIMTLVPSYTEVSPSGTGAKIYFGYKTALLAMLRSSMGSSKWGKTFKRVGDGHPPAIELYLGHRYFAVTGQHITDTPVNLEMIDGSVLMQILREVGPTFARGPETKRRDEAKHGSADASRSATAMRKGAALGRAGATFEEMSISLAEDPKTADWARDKGQANGQRELHRIWDKVGKVGGEKAETWQQYLQKDDRGQVRLNLANAAQALRVAPALTEIIVFDEMMQHAVVTRSLPGSLTPAVSEPRLLQDTDISIVQEWLQRHGLERLGREVTQQAVDLVAREHAFHPVKEYLTGLRWDNKPRLDMWLSYYLGAENSDYHRKIGRCFLIGLIARMMRPGCKMDYMLVLEGGQGRGKSAACAVLGGLWFSDNLPDLHRGDAVRLSMHLRGKWLIEIGEMSSISKADTNVLKEFLTQREERYTPKYARNEVVEPRQCSFIGTTNALTYLWDETGGRRFWPVQCTTIDIIALVQDRDQLFAEAMVAFGNGQAWWPDNEFETDHIKPEQDKRLIPDEWENIIRKWLAGTEEDGRSGPPKTRCTVAEVALHAVRLDTGRLGTTEQRRITAALERIGWEATRDKSGRWWQPKIPISYR